jgi:hypothetical protein
MGVASANQNYTHGAKEARTEMIPQPCSMTTWTHNNQSICTIAMLPKPHVLSLHMLVYTTKMDRDIIGTKEIRLKYRKYS